MGNRWGNSGNSVRLYFGGLQNHCRRWLQPWNKKTLTPWKESYDQHRQHIEKQRHYAANKGLSSQGYGFSSGHVWMWELNYKESWVLKNWCFWPVVLEKTLKSPLDCKEIQPVHPKGNQSWMFIGRTDAKAETPILWPPDAKNWLIWKDPDAGKDWSREKGTTEDEMVGWHHWLNGHEFEQALGVGDGQGGLECCSPWVCKETRLSDWTELRVSHCRSRSKSREAGSVSLHTACSHLDSLFPRQCSAYHSWDSGSVQPSLARNYGLKDWGQDLCKWLTMGKRN